MSNSGRLQLCSAAAPLGSTLLIEGEKAGSTWDQALDDKVFRLKMAQNRSAKWSEFSEYAKTRHAAIRFGTAAPSVDVVPDVVDAADALPLRIRRGGRGSSSSGSKRKWILKGYRDASALDGAALLSRALDWLEARINSYQLLKVVGVIIILLFLMPSIIGHLFAALVKVVCWVFYGTAENLLLTVDVELARFLRGAERLINSIAGTAWTRMGLPSFAHYPAGGLVSSALPCTASPPALVASSSSATSWFGRGNDQCLCPTPPGEGVIRAGELGTVGFLLYRYLRPVAPPL